MGGEPDDQGSIAEEGDEPNTEKVAREVDSEVTGDGVGAVEEDDEGVVEECAVVDIEERLQHTDETVDGESRRLKTLVPDDDEEELPEDDEPVVARLGSERVGVLCTR